MAGIYKVKCLAKINSRSSDHQITAKLALEFSGLVQKSWTYTLYAFDFEVRMNKL